MRDLHASAIEFLTAVRSGEDRAVDLATGLAETVLDVSGARLALEVLEGGAFAVTRAIRLAEHVLATRVAEDEGTGAASGGKP